VRQPRTKVRTGGGVFSRPTVAPFASIAFEPMMPISSFVTDTSVIINLA
jgi:hypothetical protein